jgi:hypothetical protein
MPHRKKRLVLDVNFCDHVSLPPTQKCYSFHLLFKIGTRNYHFFVFLVVSEQPNQSAQRGKQRCFLIAPVEHHRYHVLRVLCQPTISSCRFESVKINQNRRRRCASFHLGKRPVGGNDGRVQVFGQNCAQLLARLFASPGDKL